MTRTIIFFLTIKFLISSCGNRQVENSSIVESTIIKKDSISDNKNYSQPEISQPNTEDSCDWSTIENLNQTAENPFEVEDSIIGIGIVTIAKTSDLYNNKLSFFNSNNKIIGTIEIKETDVLTIHNDKIFNSNDDSNPFRPRLYIKNPEYFRLAFDCIKNEKEYYNVIINRQSRETARIKKTDKFFNFETIEEYVNNWTGLDFEFDRSKNPIKKSPSDNSEEINHEKQTIYKIWTAEKISIQGDWIQIKIVNTNESGWIRWRNGNLITIRLNFAC